MLIYDFPVEVNNHVFKLRELFNSVTARESDMVGSLYSTFDLKNIELHIPQSFIVFIGSVFIQNWQFSQIFKDSLLFMWKGKSWIPSFSADEYIFPYFVR